MFGVLGAIGDAHHRDNDNWYKQNVNPNVAKGLNQNNLRLILVETTVFDVEVLKRENRCVLSYFQFCLF